MKLSRSRLKEFDTPGAVAFGDDEGLMRVEHWQLLEKRLTHLVVSYVMRWFIHHPQHG